MKDNEMTIHVQSASYHLRFNSEGRVTVFINDNDRGGWKYIGLYKSKHDAWMALGRVLKLIV